MKLSLGFSPCPNDTFIFDAMIHQKIDTEGLNFDVVYDDVETLNQKAFRTDLDITKLSYHAYAYLTENYVLLHAGSALGFGVGPLLICENEDYISTDNLQNLRSQSSDFRPQTSDFRPQTSDLRPQTSDLRIGIPGKYTTANFLLSLAFPEAKNKIEMKFFEIESALLNHQIDMGVIIHENRFTYQEKGLKKIIDLGEFWENLTQGPIPLGGIMIKRDLPEEIKQKVNRIIRRSVEYAFDHPESGMDFICSLSQEMSTEVIKKHIDLYVNKFSIDLGEPGRKAVQTFFEEAHKVGIIPETKQNLFL
ncbi:1,4-dihydroxy-6-naphthoate synthase [Daejeonella sp.]|uniref:1,4-dihydroxy-6-naphthoate synthase n=1 Tax=Daejeonella sp. TaxID=2805397 RepID=UPI0027236A95|nr:1,4-dihydroxy-6-naphthoate synthase [Daejeonella sp.]MDO8994099.1 1,4-dihydroxy-6-naphthoate synthase [Daejeonella sp.]MDP2413355.1 1,4-dihydroxy-6-naphthoate synthase [Daejeonella sp.]